MHTRVELTTFLQAEHITTLDNQTKERILCIESVIAAGEKTYVLPSSMADDLRQMIEECCPGAISRIVRKTQAYPLIAM
jgi:hypothetical protein